MYLYYDLQRRLKEIVDEFPLVQYGNQANKIYAYFEGVEPSNVSSVSYTFVLNTKPNPTPITRNASLIRKEIPFSDTRDLKYFKYGQTYNFYVYELTTEDLIANGWLKITPEVYFTIGGNPVYYGTCLANVSENEIVPDEPITISQYQYLLDRVGGYEGLEIDDKLSLESENPVQNKVVTSALNDRLEIMRLDKSKPLIDIYNEIKAKHYEKNVPIVFEDENYYDNNFYTFNMREVAIGYYCVEAEDLSNGQRYFIQSLTSASASNLTLSQFLSSTYRLNYATTSDLATKQDTLVSGVNIKTINGQSLLGNGNIDVGGSGGTITVDSELSLSSENPVQNKVITSALQDKQDTLVSGTNLKTINGTSLLGSGDLVVSGGSSLPTFDFSSTNLTGTFDLEGDYATNLNSFLDNDNVVAIVQNQNPHTTIALQIDGVKVIFYASKILLDSELTAHTTTYAYYYGQYQDILYELIGERLWLGEDEEATTSNSYLVLKRSYDKPIIVNCGTVTLTDDSVLATITNADALAFSSKEFAKNVVIAFRIGNSQYLARAYYGAYAGGSVPIQYTYMAFDSQGSRYQCTFQSGTPNKIRINYIGRKGMTTVDKSSVNFALADFNASGDYIGNAFSSIEFNTRELALLFPQRDFENLILQVDNHFLNFLPEQEWTPDTVGGNTARPGDFTYVCEYGEYKYVFTFNKASGGQYENPNLYTYTMRREPKGNIYKHKIALTTRESGGDIDETFEINIWVIGKVDFTTTPLCEYKNNRLTAYPILKVEGLEITNKVYHYDLTFEYTYQNYHDRVLTYLDYVDSSGTRHHDLVDEAGYIGSDAQTDTGRKKTLAYSDQVII